MASTQSQDAKFMSRALVLAKRAEGFTSPNPMVGAVLVKGGRIVGEGYHRHAGAEHAEVEALRKARRSARGSTLYVTLEPCKHFGRTAPCCDAIIKAGISRVVIGSRDPNPITNGRGMTKLRRVGIRVKTGVLEHEAGRLNEAFNAVMRLRRPLVIAKVGQSLDGKIATRSGESRWITSPPARRYVHQLRAHVDAVLVGVGTVLRDNPLLTARGVRKRCRRPIRVILDSQLRIPSTARCLRTQSKNPSIVATTSKAHYRRKQLERRGVEVLTFPSSKGRVSLGKLCKELADRGIQSVLIEGGSEVLASAFKERIVDRIVWCIAPILIGGRKAPDSIGGVGIRRLAESVRLSDLAVRRFGADLCIEARVAYPNPKKRN